MLIKNYEYSLKINSIYLTYLSVENNENMKNFTSDIYLPNLIILILKKNKIEYLNSIIIQNYSLLQYLDLSYNPIEILELTRNLNEIIYLDISYTKINNLNNNFFIKILKIKIIKLINCKLINIDKNLFLHNYKLYEVYLNSTIINKHYLYHLTYHLKNIQIFYSQYHKLCCYLIKYSFNVHNCYPMKSVFNTCSDMLSTNIIRSIFWIIGLFGFFGNLFSIIIRIKSFNRLSHIFYILLSFADLLTAIYLLWISSADLYFRSVFLENEERWTNGILCKFLGGLMNFSLLYSMFNLLFISMEKYIAILYPMKIINQKYLIYIILFETILTIFLAFYPVYQYEVCHFIIFFNIFFLLYCINFFLGFFIKFTNLL